MALISVPPHQKYGITPYLTRVRNLSVGEELHEQDPVGPDVRLDRELAKLDRFRRRPLHWESCALKVGKKNIEASILLSKFNSVIS